MGFAFLIPASSAGVRSLLVPGTCDLTPRRTDASDSAAPWAGKGPTFPHAEPPLRLVLLEGNSYTQFGTVKSKIFPEVTPVMPIGRRLPIFPHRGAEDPERSSAGGESTRAETRGRSTRHLKDSYHWCEKSVKKSAKYQGVILRAGEPRQSRHQPACPRHPQGEVFPLSTE